MYGKSEDMRRVIERFQQPHRFFDILIGSSLRQFGSCVPTYSYQHKAIPHDPNSSPPFPSTTSFSHPLLSSLLLYSDLLNFSFHLIFPPFHTWFSFSPIFSPFQPTPFISPPLNWFPLLCSILTIHFSFHILLLCFHSLSSIVSSHFSFSLLLFPLLSSPLPSAASSRKSPLQRRSSLASASGTD